MRVHVASLVVVLLAPGCMAGFAPGEPAVESIVGGTLDTGDPAVVELADSTGGGCTAELISPHVLLTAAHCVNDPTLPAGTTFSIITAADDTGATAIPVKEVHAHPMYDPNANTSPHDIAVAILSAPLTIPPMAINRTPMAQALVGQNVRIIGYGATTTSSSNDGFGKRRQATVPLVSFDADWVNAGNSTANQCFGDSGGPALMMIQGGEVIVGVDSFGNDTGNTCLQYNSNTRVDAELGFIDPFVAANDPGFGGGGGGGGGGSDGGAGGGGTGGGSLPDGGGSTGGGGSGGNGGNGNGASSGCAMGGAAPGAPWMILPFVLSLGLARRRSWLRPR